MVGVICEASVSQLSKLKSCRKGLLLLRYVAKIVSIFHTAFFWPFAVLSVSWILLVLSVCERPKHWKSVFEVHRCAVVDMTSVFGALQLPLYLLFLCVLDVLCCIFLLLTGEKLISVPASWECFSYIVYIASTWCLCDGGQTEDWRILQLLSYLNNTLITHK